MSEPNRLEKLKRIKAVEREQLAAGNTSPPTLWQFWTQPHGVQLLLIRGDVVDRVASIVQDRGMTPSEQRTGRMLAYPAHVGTLLSRPRRSGWSVMKAAWFSLGWTKVQETTGGTLSTDAEQIGVIARSMDAWTIGVHYDGFNGNLGLIEAGADGTIRGQTYITPVARQPRGALGHPAMVADPTPTGITKVLDVLGFDVHAHMLPKTEMLTILTVYR